MTGIILKNKDILTEVKAILCHYLYGASCWICFMLLLVGILKNVFRNR